MPPRDVYVCDADCLVNLHRHFGREAISALRRSARSGKVKLPEGVAREILRGTDKLAEFVEREERTAVVKVSDAFRLRAEIRRLEGKYGETIVFGRQHYGGFWKRTLFLNEDPTCVAEKSRLLELIRDHFKVSTEPEIPPDCLPNLARKLRRRKKNRKLFPLVYQAVGDTSPCPLPFNAQYGLFRVLLTMFALLALISLAYLVWAGCCRPALWLSLALWSAVFVAATIIAYFRCKKRGEDFAQSVYHLFMATGGSKAASNKQT